MADTTATTTKETTIQESSDAPAEPTKKTLSQSQRLAEKCNELAEQYLIQGEVYSAEKLLQKGIRSYRTERGIKLLTELVEGRDRAKVAGREYKGRRSAVDGAIRAMFGASDTLNLEPETVNTIVAVCQGSEERAANLYAELEFVGKKNKLTPEQANAIVVGMSAQWLRKTSSSSSSHGHSHHGHSHNGVPCEGHGHVQGSALGPHANVIVGMASMSGIIGLLAHQFGSRLPVVVILAPLGSMFSVLFTLAVCYYLWRTGNNIRDPRVIFPAISELGASMPEHRVYQVGFAITGLLLALHIRLFSQLVLPKLLEHDASGDMKTHADLAISWGYYSAVGVILQGVFTLEMKVSMQSMVHWAGAVLFMSGAMNHAQASKTLYAKVIENNSDHVAVLRNESLLSAVSFRKMILDYSSFFMFVPIIIAQIVFASSTAEATTAAQAAATAAAAQRGEEAPPPMQDPKTMNTMGVMQWAIILQFAVYFCTYAVDLWVCVNDDLKMKMN